MRYGAIIALSVALFGLTGCGKEGEFKKMYACAIAANELEQYQARSKINKSIDLFVRDSGFKPTSADMIRLTEEIKYDDWDLAGRDAGSQYKILLKEFNSGYCQKIHGQDDLNLR